MTAINNRLNAVADFGDVVPACVVSLCGEAAAEISRLQAQVDALAMALDHAVCIAEDRQPGTWDDLLQYRAALAAVGR